MRPIIFELKVNLIFSSLRSLILSQGICVPALFTKISIPPNSAIVFATASLQNLALLISPPNEMAFRPNSSISFSACSASL